MSRQLGLSLWASARELLRPLLAAGAMVAVLLGVNTLISTPAPALLVGVPLGAGVYLGALWLLAAEDLRKLRRTAFPGAPAASEPSSAAGL